MEGVLTLTKDSPSRVPIIASTSEFDKFLPQLILEEFHLGIIRYLGHS